MLRVNAEFVAAQMIDIMLLGYRDAIDALIGEPVSRGHLAAFARSRTAGSPNYKLPVAMLAMLRMEAR